MITSASFSGSRLYGRKAAHCSVGSLSRILESAEPDREERSSARSSGVAASSSAACPNTQTTPIHTVLTDLSIHCTRPEARTILTLL
eukprot:872770-Prorocentrum_minimum.AAC.5